MRYLDVCAGISASTVAWKTLGWEAAAYSEIEAAPRAVLAYHYPDVPLHGDVTTIRGDEYGAIDLLVGGTPCQDFSVAGLRKGLDGDRGNLTLEFLRLADRTRPRWLVWENVPGVLSIDGGRAFGAILGGLGQLGYGFAYRVLDAQYFGVPQRRRRVFVVGHSGDWRGAAAVLSERHSMSGNSAPAWPDHGSDAPLAFNSRQYCTSSPHVFGALSACHPQAEAIAFQASQSGFRQCMTHATLDANNGPRRHNGVLTDTGPRRLTPRECERLQGFPDDYTLVPHQGKQMADGPRYKTLGNSMAVPVMRWIGERIAAVDKLPKGGTLSERIRNDNEPHRTFTAPVQADLALSAGAGEGNRTLVVSLGSLRRHGFPRVLRGSHHTKTGNRA